MKNVDEIIFMEIRDSLQHYFTRTLLVEFVNFRFFLMKR